MEWISNLIFELNDAQILFGMFQGFKKATPYGGAKKLRLTLPPVRRVEVSSIKDVHTPGGGDFWILYVHILQDIICIWW